MNAAQKELWESVIERDEGLCIQCGAQGCHVHHIVPRWHRGAWTMLNMLCLCVSCHNAAHNRRARRILIREMQRRYGYDYTEPMYKGLVGETD